VLDYRKTDKEVETMKFTAKMIDGTEVEGLLSVSQGHNGHPEKGYYISNSAGSPWAYRIVYCTLKLHVAGVIYSRLDI